MTNQGSSARVSIFGSREWSVKLVIHTKGQRFELEQRYFKVSTLKYHVLKYLQIMVNVNVVNEIIYESTRKIKINKNVHYKSTRNIKINKIKVLKARNH